MEPWALYLHNILVHFPIAATATLAALGAWTRDHEHPRLIAFIRWAGWSVLALTALACLTGLLVGAEVAGELRHHRDLGLLALAICALAAWCYEQGARLDGARDWRMLGVALWLVATLAGFGAGHWGGATNNPDKLPWESEVFRRR